MTKRWVSPDERKPDVFQDEPDVGHAGCNFCNRWVPCVTVLYWSICRSCAAMVAPLLDRWEADEQVAAEREAEEIARHPPEPPEPEGPPPPIKVPRSLFCLKCLSFRANCRCPAGG